MDSILTKVLIIGAWICTNSYCAETAPQIRIKRLSFTPFWLKDGKSGLMSRTSRLEPYILPILNSDGVKLNFCPELGLNNLQNYRYDRKHGVCSSIGSRGHCGENMVFYSVENDEIYGQCDCSYNSQRPLIYHEPSEKCHFLYDQGYCKRGEWLIFGQKNVPMCSLNKCQAKNSHIPSNSALYVPLNGTGHCVKLNEPSEHCSNEEHIVTFANNQLYPKCYPLEQVSIQRGLSLSRTLECKPGTYLNIVGKCQPPFEW